MKIALSIFKILSLKEKFYIYFLIILGCIAAILEALSVVSILPLLNAIADTEQEYKILFFSFKDFDLKFIITFFFLIIIFKNLYFIFFTYFNLFVVDKIYLNLCGKVLKNNLDKEYLDFNKLHSGEFIRNLHSFTKSVREFLIALINLIVEIIILISIISILLFYDYLLTLKGLIFIALFFNIYYFSIRSKIDYFSKIKFNEETNINKILISIFNGFTEITLNNTKKYFNKIFLSTTGKYIKSVRFIQFYSLTPRFILELVIVLLLLIVFNVNGLSKNQILSSLPIIGLYILAGYRILPSFNRINNNILAIKSIKIALDYIYKEISIIKNNNSNIKILKKIEKISFKNLNYIYPDTKNKVFKKNINLTFEIGTCYGLFGKSGSGKSTLTKIISGLITDYQGSYYLNNKLIKKNYFKLNRLDLSYVPQKPYFLDIDLYKNITQDFENNYKNLKQYRYALKKSHSETFLTQKKIDYKTVLTEDAHSLSGGQKQRLSIARAFYKSSKIIILDEATNALDKRNEMNIIKTLKRKYKKNIIIIISHNESILSCCDKIIRI
tara:strand:+ start:2395 stop:4059 length:1665 start_codon:yes stop_codon:yes gene_type:complete